MVDAVVNFFAEREQVFGDVGVVLPGDVDVFGFFGEGFGGRRGCLGWGRGVGLYLECSSEGSHGCSSHRRAVAVDFHRVKRRLWRLHNRAFGFFRHLLGFKRILDLRRHIHDNVKLGRLLRARLEIEEHIRLVYRNRAIRIARRLDILVRRAIKGIASDITPRSCRELRSDGRDLLELVLLPSSPRF